MSKFQSRPVREGQRDEFRTLGGWQFAPILEPYEFLVKLSYTRKSYNWEKRMTCDVCREMLILVKKTDRVHVYRCVCCHRVFAHTVKS